ncbi:DUF6334 family protein [Caulobacter sp. RHG1]|uniref:DUF6334 family protein n=1 Tax=Caulobacter sp. (strain RHG1) TaxID=2545762 RepID=UPI001557FA31|nr:DUF6334 family protein [Caulobacter sp. RHG1]
MLQFDYEAIDGEAITAVVGRADGVDGRWSVVSIVLGARALVLRVDPDSDEISATLEAAPGGAEWIPIAPMQAVVGTALGWCWVGRNYRGYLDTFILSCSDLEPQFLFIGMASAIHLRRISEFD